MCCYPGAARAGALRFISGLEPERFVFGAECCLLLQAVWEALCANAAWVWVSAHCSWFQLVSWHLAQLPSPWGDFYLYHHWTVFFLLDFITMLLFLFKPGRRYSAIAQMSLCASTPGEKQPLTTGEALSSALRPSHCCLWQQHPYFLPLLLEEHLGPSSSQSSTTAWISLPMELTLHTDS